MTGSAPPVSPGPPYRPPSIIVSAASNPPQDSRSGTRSFWDPRTFLRTYITWNACTPIEWANTTAVRVWLRSFEPGRRRLQETNVQQDAADACKAIAARPDPDTAAEKEREVLIMTSAPLSEMHAKDAFANCRLMQVYEAQRRTDPPANDSLSQDGAGTRSDRRSSQAGACLPDRAIAWSESIKPPGSHVTLQIEFKIFDSPAACRHVHRYGFAQIIAYLMGAYEVCRTCLALIVLNNFFHRLAMLPSTDDGRSPEAQDLYIEVHENSGLTGVWQEDEMALGVHAFGPGLLVNEMQHKVRYHDEDVGDHTSFQRYWRFIVLALQLAARACTLGICARDDTEPHLLVEQTLLDGLPDAALRIRNKSRAYLTHANTTETGEAAARRNLKRRAAGVAAAGSGLEHGSEDDDREDGPGDHGGAGAGGSQRKKRGNGGGASRGKGRASTTSRSTGGIGSGSQNQHSMAGGPSDTLARGVTGSGGRPQDTEAGQTDAASRRDGERPTSQSGGSSTLGNTGLSGKGDGKSAEQALDLHPTETAYTRNCSPPRTLSTSGSSGTSGSLFSREDHKPPDTSFSGNGKPSVDATNVTPHDSSAPDSVEQPALPPTRAVASKPETEYDGDDGFWARDHDELDMEKHGDYLLRAIWSVAAEKGMRIIGVTSAEMDKLVTGLRLKEE